MEKLAITGQCRHLWGDSTEKSSWDELFSAGAYRDQADLILADPPYCLLTRRNKKTGQKRDPKRAKINHEAVRRFKNVKDYRIFTRAWLEHAVRHLHPAGKLVIWTNFLGKAPIIQEMESFKDFCYWDSFVWAKYTKEGQGNEKLCRVYEEALVFSRQMPPPADPATPALSWSVVGLYDDLGEAEKYGAHPNHKSFNVIEPLIRNFSRPGDLVVDPFTGSGSTPKAAQQLERVCFGIELREHWCRMTRQRLQEST